MLAIVVLAVADERAECEVFLVELETAELLRRLLSSGVGSTSSGITRSNAPMDTMARGLPFCDDVRGKSPLCSSVAAKAREAEYLS